MTRVPLQVPRTLSEALDPRWLEAALAPMSGGARVVEVETVEVIRTIATKVRFVVGFDDGARHALCLKGLLDVGPAHARGGSITLLEADFYDRLANQLTVRVPRCVATVVDRDDPFAVVIMRDLIAEGDVFHSALDHLSPGQVALSLEQLGRLHAGGIDVGRHPWVARRISRLAEAPYITDAQLQDLLDAERGETLPAEVRDAGALRAAMRALAVRDLETPDVLVHGDAHAGNLFSTPDGPGLIDWQLLQAGGWALDVAYHIAALLPVTVAEREERRLLDGYLSFVRAMGGTAPDRETAWRLYREAAVYGYYLWSITRSVDPVITNIFVARLGASVARHGSFRLLDVSGDRLTAGPVAARV